MRCVPFAISIAIASAVCGAGSAPAGGHAGLGSDDALQAPLWLAQSAQMSGQEDARDLRQWGMIVVDPRERGLLPNGSIGPGIGELCRRIRPKPPLCSEEDEMIVE